MSRGYESLPFYSVYMDSLFTNSYDILQVYLINP